MVYTRQMTIGNNGSGEFNQYNLEGPAKFTRNSTPAVIPGCSGTMQYCKALLPSVPSMNLLSLPQEVLEKIFSYLPFKNICQLRLVCRNFDRICGQLLNLTFMRLQNQMLSRFQDIKAKMPRRESARRSHHLAIESDIIETLHMRLNLLQMSFGKHIERKHICFFPGDILDEVYRILHYIRVTPKLDVPYKVTDELFDLSTMAMEYFKEKIEPNLPEIAYFSTDFLKFSRNIAGPASSKFLSLDSTTLLSEVSKDSGHASTDELESEDMVETIPQSNMVLRKRIRKIKQGMKRYNSQLSLLRQDLRNCKKKSSDQQKQISEQQKQLADQQKQTLQYATRLDEFEKKSEEMSRKFGTLLQELNKCKTELQYYRCKSASPRFCSNCGNAILPQPEQPEELINPEVLVLEQVSDNALPNTENSFQNNIQIQEEEDVKIEIEKKQNPERPSTSGEKVKTSKRKIEDKLEEYNLVMKTRRLSKIRNKRTKV